MQMGYTVIDLIVYVRYAAMHSISRKFCLLRSFRPLILFWVAKVGAAIDNCLLFLFACTEGQLGSALPACQSVCPSPGPGFRFAILNESYHGKVGMANCPRRKQLGHLPLKRLMKCSIWANDSEWCLKRASGSKAYIDYRESLGH